MSNLIDSNGVSEDIQMDVPRGRSAITSANSSRALSMLSKAFSVEYTAYIKV